MRDQAPYLLAVTSDHHANSTLGLVPEEGVQLDDGGRYIPSKSQRWTWDCWKAFWADVESLRRAEKAKLIAIFNGDLVDGDHHQTSQIVSRNMEVQGYIATRVFSVPKQLKPHKCYVVRGTEAHTGPSGASEESLAKHLHADRAPDDQTWSAWHLRLMLHGLLVDCLHHGRIGTRPWTKQNALSALALHIWMEHIQAGIRPPDVAFRSDRHVFGDSFGAYPTRVVQTPAWQLKTAFAHKVAPESIADIGGILCLVQPDSTYTIIPKLYQPALPEIRTP